MNGIVAYGAYLPRYRLQRTAIAAALGLPAATGSRTVATYDEDTTTMGVAAAKRARPSTALRSLYFATTAPAYWQKTNATAIHAALDLDSGCFAVDLAGSARSAVAGLRSAAVDGGLAVLSDIVTGLPGSADESGSCDGAAAFLFGAEDQALAVTVAEASVSSEFLDRWALPGEKRIRRWEERFGMAMYTPLVEEAARAALAAAGVETPDHVVASSPHRRVAAAAEKAFAARNAPALSAFGYAGAADVGLRLAATLDVAEPGDTILAIIAVDGCDASVIRVTERIAQRRPEWPLAAQLADGTDVSYYTYATWRGQLEREPPRRPEPDRPAGPPAARAASWKFGFVGTRCRSCGFIHLPPARVCKQCGTVDEMEDARLAQQTGTVATFTVDRLAFSPAPPVIDVVVDFDGGGRSIVEMTDVDPDEVRIGTRVEMTFRRLYTADGVHNYFWKARPLRAPTVGGDGDGE